MTGRPEAALDSYRLKLRENGECLEASGRKTDLSDRKHMIRWEIAETPENKLNHRKSQQLICENEWKC